MDDLTVVNLEGVLSDSNAGENKEKTYRFRGEPEYTEILTYGSVEMVNLANNHTFDYGERGYLETQVALAQSGIRFFGGRETTIFEKYGIRIAFLGLSYTEETRVEKEWIKEEIRRLKREENVNAVVFSYHGGREYSEARTQKQVDIAELAVDAGADLVIMHHPHVVQGMSVLDNRSVCYSLGNFCFGGNKNVRAMESLVVAATLHFSDDGEYLGQQIDLYPAHISGTEPSSNYQPLLVTGQEAKRVMRLVQADGLDPVEVIHNLWEEDPSVDMYEVYAEGQDVSLGQAADELRNIVKAIFGDDADVMIDAAYLMPALRNQTKKGKIEGIADVGTATGKGGYEIQGIQMMNGIPILGSAVFSTGFSGRAENILSKGFGITRCGILSGERIC